MMICGRKYESSVQIRVSEQFHSNLSKFKVLNLFKKVFIKFLMVFVFNWVDYILDFVFQLLQKSCKGSKDLI